MKKVICVAGAVVVGGIVVKKVVNVRKKNKELYQLNVEKVMDEVKSRMYSEDISETKSNAFDNIKSNHEDLYKNMEKMYYNIMKNTSTIKEDEIRTAEETEKIINKLSEELDKFDEEL